MFSFFKKKPVVPETPAPAVAPSAPEPVPQATAEVASDAVGPLAFEVETAARPEKQSWMNRLKAGLSKTSANLSVLFIGAKIDDDLYDELEAALLMSDAGIEATQYLLDALKRKVKEDKLLDAAAVKLALKQLLIELL